MKRAGEHESLHSSIKIVQYLESINDHLNNKMLQHIKQRNIPMNLFSLSQLMFF